MRRNPTRIAVIMTCHNRRDSTLKALESLWVSCSQPVEIQVFIVDDGSSDGTAEEISAHDWPVNIIPGRGDLFWAAGMCIAERAAMRWRADFLLWLNDDVVLDAGCLDVLLDLSLLHLDRAIIVGSVRDPTTGELTYGGRLRTSSWHPQRFIPADEGDVPKKVDAFNGNLVLVPRDARLRIGPIDGLFPHAYADDDYGLRAQARGVVIIQAPGTLGTCPRIDHDLSSGSPVRRWRALREPKGLPLGAQARYLRRHGTRTWPALLLMQRFRRLLLPQHHHAQELNSQYQTGPTPID